MRDSKAACQMSTRVPPDGGWGWMIVLAFSLNNLSTIPIIQGFGLVFKDTFAILGLSATDGSIIINTNMAFGMLAGLINGPLLRSYGYRKIAILGSISYTIGVALTGFANSMTLILISYGILASIGMGMGLSSYSLALNSYFTTKRNRAMGLAMTIIGLGPIFMPQLMSFLLSFYGIQGTMLLLGALSLHSLIGAMLLQPLKWHVRTIQGETTNTDDPDIDQAAKNHDIVCKTDLPECEDNASGSSVELHRHQQRRKTTISSIDHDIDIGSIYGYDTTLPPLLSGSIKGSSCDKNVDQIGYNDSSSTYLPERSLKARLERIPWATAKSSETVHLGSCLQIFDEISVVYQPLIMNTTSNVTEIEDEKHESISSTDSSIHGRRECSALTDITDSDRNECKQKCKRSTILRMLKRISDFYDLALLKDPIYVNIMIGMSIAIFAEVNFSMLTPFILADMGLTTVQIANVMSVIAIIDLTSRGVAPYIGEWIHQPPRTMYLYSLVLLIISRSSLLITDGIVSIMIVAVGLGVAKGIRTVYMALVVPSHVPIWRLPYANGIQMAINGVILLIAGPILGIIRDRSGSYTPCIIIMNCVTAFTVTLWLAEMCILRKLDRKKREKSKGQACEQIV